MGGIFISHSSKNSAEAERLRAWLEAQGWGRSQVFLDLQDLKSGDSWRDVLNAMGDKEAVIVCLSNEWLGSHECVREFTQAQERGKPILPIFVAPVTVPIPRFITDLQIGDATKDDGFQSLRDGLLAKRITPQSFPWPPPNEPGRSVYRGLQALDVQDAAIFFGRDADIAHGLDELRRLRNGSSQRLLVILGASGSGKSSFLRAGLIPRLKRDEENFLVLPVVRPGRSALNGAQGLTASVSTALGRQMSSISARGLAQAFADLRIPVMERLYRNAGAAREAYSAKPPTIVLLLDQAEELFAADHVERDEFSEIVSGAIAQDGNALLVATIRSDAYESLQNGLMAESQKTFSLPAIAAGSFQEIIEGPARLAKPPLTVEPELTQQLLADLNAADALPLLAFTLERLRAQFGQDGILSLADYREKLGGLSGAIQSAVNAVIGAQPSQDTVALARHLFVPALVQVGQDGVKRRVARRTDIPPETQQLVSKFIDQRLLVSNDGTIEVAHEAILRQWSALAGWIADERDALALLAGVRSASLEWHSRERDETWLLHRGARLVDSLALAERREYSSAFDSGARTYLRACSESERRGHRLRRRTQAIAAALAATTLVASLLATFGITRLMSAQSARASNTLAELAREASDDQDYERAARFALAGMAGSQDIGFGFDSSNAQLELARALSMRLWRQTLRGDHGQPRSMAFSADGSSLVTRNDDDTISIWNPRQGRLLHTFRFDTLQEIQLVALNHDGTRIIVTTPSAISIQDATTGNKIGRLGEDDGFLSNLELSEDGRFLTATTGSPEGPRTLRVWSVVDLREVFQAFDVQGTMGRVLSHDGSLVLSVERSCGVCVRQTSDGTIVGRALVELRRDTFASVSADGTRVLAASSNLSGPLTVWDVRSSRRISALRAQFWSHGIPVLNYDGSRVLTGQLGGLRLWNADTGDLVRALISRSPDQVVLPPNWSFSPDGRLVLSGWTDRATYVWNSETGQLETRLQGDLPPVAGAIFGPDSASVASVENWQSDIRYWDLHPAIDRQVLERAAGRIFDIVPSPSGDRALSHSDGGTIAIWDISNGRRLAELHAPDGFYRAEFSADGERVLTTAQGSQPPRVWNARTGEVVVSLSPPGIVSFSPTADRVVGAAGSIIRVWRAADGQLLREIEVPGARLNSPVFGPDGRSVLVSSSPDVAGASSELVVDIDTGNIVARHPGRAWSHSFSPSGERAIFVDGTEAAVMWDTATGRTTSTLLGTGQLLDAHFSADERMVVAASTDQIVRLWDVQTGELLHAMRGQGESVRKASFSSDGRHILSVGETTIRLWDVATGRRIASYDTANAGALSSDGRTIISVGRDYSLQLHRLPTQLFQSGEVLTQSFCPTRGGGSGDQGANSIVPPDEFLLAPILDPSLNADACHVPNIFSRLSVALSSRH